MSTTPELFESVWDALEDTPAAAANMTMRSDLLNAIAARVRSWDLTQAEAARRLGLNQPRLNYILRGKVGKFSLDMLVSLAVQAGLSVRIDVTDAGASTAQTLEP